MRGGPPNPALDVTITASSPGPRIDETLPRGSGLGRYVILERLGTGGMGIVYAAYDPELDRRIALKLLRSSNRSSAEQRARLLREAQAMARINHPNVIAVHDVGVVDERVFVAMELVEGATLESWLGARPREPAEIVRAFVQAAHGLAAAHDRGLVHRDFKPDNVLVGVDGRVRVLDFGIAFVEDGTAASEALTRDDTVLGTPWYMSPEQLAGGRPDARSDQWSFCASLHEALYGEHPFAQPGDSDLATLERRVRSGARREPPSEKASRVAARVRSALERGLSVDPDARFPSMRALVAELEPPAPRPARAGWIAVALGAIAVAAVGLALRPKPVAVCDGALHELDGVWDAARKHRVSEAFAAIDRPFSRDAYGATASALDAYAAAWTSMQKEACEATRVRGVQSEELLDLRTQCLGERRAELQSLVGILEKADVESAGRAPVAARSLSALDACANAALLRAPTRLPADPAARDAIAGVRARVARVRALERAGRYADMLAEARDLAGAAERTGFRPARAEAEAMLGRAQKRSGDDRAARDTLLDAVLDAEASHDDAVAAETWPALVVADANLFAFDPADDAARHAAAAIERVGGDARDEIDLERASCTLERHRGRYEEAAAHARAALALSERSLGPDDPRVADVLNELSVVLNAQGKYDEAAADLERALRIDEKALGPDHPELGNVCASLSNAYEYRGDGRQALAFAQRGLAIREKALGPDHPLVAANLIDLGNAQDALGDLEGAMASYARALQIRERTAGEESPKTASVLYNMAQLRLLMGDAAGALADARRAVAIQEKAKGPDHTDVGIGLSAVGDALGALGRSVEALPLHERALTILEAGFGKEHPDVAAALVGIGRDQLALHQGAAAVATLERAVAILAKGEVPARDRADADFALARALWASGGDRSRARALADGARATYAAGGHPLAGPLAQAEAWLHAHGP
jgi:tetratricopeptide (TPR) repeat protein/tRNA A-37 threonylcarbamoyl transferase component Bud32